MKKNIQIRAVQYPCIIGGEACDRVGIFEVEIHDNRPMRASMLHFVGYGTTKELMEFYDTVGVAIFDLPTLNSFNTVNLDDEPMWDGTLTFEPTAVLL